MLLLWGALAIAISITARPPRLQAGARDAADVKKSRSPSWGGHWAILFPIILLAGPARLRLHASEIGAFAVIYAVAVGFFAYRMLTLAGFRDAVEGSLVDVGAVMFLLALSAIFGYGIVFERIPEVISNWMLGITDNANVVMVMIVIFILLAGTFMEGSVLIIMLTHSAAGHQYGIDRSLGSSSHRRPRTTPAAARDVRGRGRAARSSKKKKSRHFLIAVSIAS